jgi:hypothetical protein
MCRSQERKTKSGRQIGQFRKMTGEHCKKYLFCLKSGNGYGLYKKSLLHPRLYLSQETTSWIGTLWTLFSVLGNITPMRFTHPSSMALGAYIKTTFTNPQIVKNQREAVREM